MPRNRIKKNHQYVIWDFVGMPSHVHIVKNMIVLVVKIVHYRLRGILMMKIKIVVGVYDIK